MIEKVEKTHQAVQQLSEMKERLEKMEVKLDRGDLGKPTGDKRSDEHLKAFTNWIRNPFDMDLKAALQKASKDVIEGNLREKAVTSGTSSAGGYAVPELISREINQNLINSNPFRSLVKVLTVGTPDYKELVDIRGESSGWIGEGGTRSETNTPRLQEVAPTFGTLYAYPKASEESLVDLFFDVQTWLTRAVSDEFGYQEGVAIISGNGTNKPTGFLNGSTATTDDGTHFSPNRAFGTLQYVPTGQSNGFDNSTGNSPEGQGPGDCLITMIYKLRARYLTAAKWVMNRGTMATIQKFRDRDGNYLWRPGLEAGRSDTLFGYPVVLADDMPSIAAGTYPVAFGDWRAAYVLCDLVGLRMTVDEITTPGQVKFYVRKRLGGKLVQDEAIKVLKVAAS